MRRTISLFALAILLVGLVPAATPSFAAPNDAPIHLKATTFRPGLGEKPDIPPGLTIAEPERGQPGYYLVQFDGPVQAGWMDAVTDLGAELLEYVPEFAFKAVLLPENFFHGVLRNDKVTNTDYFQHIHLPFSITAFSNTFLLAGQNYGLELSLYL